MATALTHAALPFFAGAALKVPWRTRLLGCALAVAADLDVAAYLFHVGPDALLGHRGLFHSLLFALLLAGAATWLVRDKGPRATLLAPPRAPRGRFLAAAALSHPLVDLFTFGESGVALFAPFSAARFLLPWRPVPALPLGADEALSDAGLHVLANEVLWLWGPVLIACFARRRVLAVAAVAWLSLAVSLKKQLPELFGLPLPRLVRPVQEPDAWEDLSVIPRDGPLVTRLDALRPLLGVEHRVEPPPWSGGFFPYWLGGEAGRWREPNPLLALRTLTGVALPAAAEVKALLERGGAEAEALSPAEKYDLARGDYGLSATRFVLAQTHNARPRPRFWFGLCNGLAAAGVREPEPVRRVEVVNPDGLKVSFHPNDVKALLASAHYTLEGLEALGGQCVYGGLDAARICAMSSGGFVITLLNVLGLQRRSFMIDVHPSRQNQFFAVASGRVELRGAPRPPAGEPLHSGLRGRVRSLVDFTAHVTVSSTLLPASAADQLDPAHPDGTWYRPVGLVPVPFSWEGTLALDETHDIIGGSWAANGPDTVAFINGGPAQTDAGALETNPAMRWPEIAALAAASADRDAGTPTLTAEALCGGPCR